MTDASSKITANQQLVGRLGKISQDLERILADIAAAGEMDALMFIQTTGVFDAIAQAQGSLAPGELLDDPEFDVDAWIAEGERACASIEDGWSEMGVQRIGR
jgi:hypothetical protein